MPTDAPEYRAYFARVLRTERTSPSFVRITFTGPDLADFGYAGVDQRLKLLIAQPGRSLDDLPTGHDWYLKWRALDEAVRPVMRTYTVRDFRSGVSGAELDVDFVLHGTHDDAAAGPMSTWAADAQPGDQVAIMGPDRPGHGRLWGAEWSLPPDTRHVLLAGDETALPAMGAILESLPESVTAIVCAEVPDHADIPEWSCPTGATVSWLVRGHDGERGAGLRDAVQAALTRICAAPGRSSQESFDRPEDEILLWDIPEDGVSEQRPTAYVWMAGEAGVMRELRRLARGDFALPRSAVACMGYWRQGRSEAA
jgi:NADPH-dependent ferric siderophore reductase